jgi:hypothetical protein
MSTVYDTLIKRLDPALRVTIQRRTDAMMRQIDYLRENGNTELIFIQTRGWTKPRLEILCSLNSFYQIVIGPLASSARRETRIGLGQKIPIKYGEEIVFDASRSREIRAVHSAFLALVQTTNLPNKFLHANHADDLIFEISRFLHASSAD